MSNRGIRTPTVGGESIVTDIFGPAGLALTRRGFMAGLAGTAAATALPAPQAWALPALPPVRDLAFRSLHTGETFRAAYVVGGLYDPVALAGIDTVLRDWRTGESRAMDRRLLDFLFALRRRLDTDAPFEVISGYRSPKTNAKLAAKSGGVAKRSLHMRGMAIDIHLPGRPLADLHRAALALKAGGVGLYSKSGFVHVDTGRVRRWGR
jgi:uncharacterized protein YcbK (DUF882 family)